jgi:hypothetical protein
MRILRTYLRIAQIEHWCDNCCQFIMPGECYKASVRIEEGQLVVYKYHIFPSCDPPEDPDKIRKYKPETEPAVHFALAA